MKISAQRLSFAIFALIIIAVIISVGRTFSGGSKPPAGAGGMGPPTVSVAPALEKPVTEWDDFSGRVQAIDWVEVRPQVSGLIDSVHFQDGQLVKKGDLLFTIDPRPFQAEVTRTEALLAGAQARVALAKTNQDRSTKLIANRVIAQTELDQNNDASLEADAALKAAEAAVQTAHLNLAYTAITAPVTGRVSRAEVTPGNLVESGNSAPVLTTVVSVSPVYVEFEIDEQSYLKYAAKGANGNSGVDHILVSMGLANEEGYPHEGHLGSFDNHLDTSSGTIRVRAIFDNANGELTPGLYANVRVGGSGEEQAVLVDDRAVSTDQDKKYVLVVGDDNKAMYRAVTLGPVIDGLRVIRSGLEKDERIVVKGLQRVRPNSVVVPENVSMERNADAAGTPQVAASK